MGVISKRLHPDGIGQPAVARARGFTITTLGRAEDAFEGDDKARAFIARLQDRSDLGRQLESAIGGKVQDSQSNNAISGIVLAEIDRLWRKSPPSNVDLLARMFKK